MWTRWNSDGFSYGAISKDRYGSMYSPSRNAQDFIEKVTQDQKTRANSTWGPIQGPSLGAMHIECFPVNSTRFYLDF